MQCSQNEGVVATGAKRQLVTEGGKGDDFITLGPPQSRGCASSLMVLEETCQQLGVPIAAGGANSS